MELPTVVVTCPYCWEYNELIIDLAVQSQIYVEDCHVCCRPMVVSVEAGADGEPRVDVRGEDD